MGGRGSSFHSESQWIKANEDYAAWQAFKYNHPREYTPDSLDRAVRNAERVGAELMKKALKRSKLLSFNENSHKAFGKTKEGYYVTVNSGLGSGTVFVETTKRFKVVDYKVFKTHKEAVKYAEKIIQNGIN